MSASLAESKINQLIRTATQAYDCIVEHLKRYTDRVAPKKGVLKRILEESLEEEVGSSFFSQAKRLLSTNSVDLIGK